MKIQRMIIGCLFSLTVFAFDAHANAYTCKVGDEVRTLLRVDFYSNNLQKYIKLPAGTVVKIESKPIGYSPCDMEYRISMVRMQAVPIRDNDGNIVACGLENSYDSGRINIVSGSCGIDFVFDCN